MSATPTITFDQFETLNFAQLDDVVGGAWSWGDFGRNVGKGAVVGGVTGGVAGAFTGPGVVASAGIGAAAGAVGGAVEYTGQAFGLWK